jgi:hypothetical protein
MVTCPRACSTLRHCGWRVVDGEDDPGLLVVTRGVSSQLKDFGGKVLEYGSEVRST